MVVVIIVQGIKHLLKNLHPIPTCLCHKHGTRLHSGTFTQKEMHQWMKHRSDIFETTGGGCGYIGIWQI